MKKVMREHFLERYDGTNGVDLRLVPNLPASLNIEVNSSCNHSCVVCPYHAQTASHSIGSHVMDFEMVKKILDEASRLGIGRKEVGFYMNGEPFLYPKLPDVIRYAKTKGFPYTYLTTNGSMSTPERLKAVVDAGLDSIRFSVNGCNREQYKEFHGRDDFDRVCEHIRFLSEYRKKSGSDIGVSISCVITKKTDGIQNEVRELFSAFVDDIIFIPVLVMPAMRSALTEYIFDKDLNPTIDENYVCKSVFHGMYIDAKGRVLVCCQAYGEKDEVSVAYDLKDGIDLEKAWASPTFQRYRRMFMEHQGLKGTICESCYLTLRKNEEIFQD